jgi:glutamyl/glutaminyl-tRNA synthetase
VVTRGPIAFQTDLIGDPVLVRTSGAPLYNFAVVVDDVTMRITDVIRGEGHISNTPVQLLIYRALGAQPPRLGHVSHLLTPGRGRRSQPTSVLLPRRRRRRRVRPRRRPRSADRAGVPLPRGGALTSASP